mmetsp:Transcript_37573/g.63242  ORF Transcript_37573/g.63242 Transcript_37573/m.63242 type:complete len:282 (+) Transcript_37573:273-1118(+)|eukprot:CAMPEP_0198230366 /NCGR_PEP_ID=MMETSP1445-20131203/114627_1 /TAXON_ID=36898 /ORGANISM="Pyramimonas sp., Strain CCMP2087" /LENGTH=281 /DNA_ID=CAMNT_0043910903 /DNA_START=154 /DNA_END=999 /DNA_ORIENTATION=+
METPEVEVDSEYPGTATQRLNAAVCRAKSLAPEQLDGEWGQVRRWLLWAAGLRDLSTANRDQGYTGHCFNDAVHCDATTMVAAVSHNTHDGQIRGIEVGSQLGPSIHIASLRELGPGGSWCTCINGSHTEPPTDVAHVQFRSRIAWKLVWSATSDYTSFVLVDDAGKLLNYGTPSMNLPSLRERRTNYKMVQGSKYVVAADQCCSRQSLEITLSRDEVTHPLAGVLEAGILEAEVLEHSNDNRSDSLKLSRTSRDLVRTISREIARLDVDVEFVRGLPTLG